jgi:hypothetical protein
MDARLAVLLSRRPSLTRGGLAAAVDRVVAQLDADAVRRAKQVAEERFVDVRDNESGMAWVDGNVFATTGQALRRRLEELAATAEALVCGCGSAGCGAAAPARPAQPCGDSCGRRACHVGRHRFRARCVARLRAARRALRDRPHHRPPRWRSDPRIEPEKPL